MADDFDTFSRGDLIYKGASMGEVMNGRAALANGDSIVKTLRRGVAGFHKGTLEGTVSWTEAVIKAGMNTDFVKVILKHGIVRIVAVLNDEIRIQFLGPIASGTFPMGENSFITSDMSVTGKISLV